MTTQAQRDERVGKLFDYLADHPRGVSLAQMQNDLGLTEGPMQRTLRDLRLLLGSTDEINIVCDPQGSREPWLYRLVGNLEAAKPWHDNQRRHLEARLATNLAVARSLVAATDGRSLEGKRAKRIATVLSRLLEDIEELAPSP